MICPICKLTVKDCPMLNGEMNMYGSPKELRGYWNRKEPKGL